LLPQLKLVPGFQYTTDSTNKGFIIFPAAGWLAVDFLVAIRTNFDPLVHYAAIIWLCLLPVKVAIGKRPGATAPVLP